MKKRLFIGLGLLGVAFSGAAFTANKTLQTNHYIQKPNNCQQIPVTECEVAATPLCSYDDGTGTYNVYQLRSNAAQCNTPLFERPN
ncbi:DUF6520 family protein [Sphingobacterium spiritivorum]|uniref:DUF6520 family protein n=1 Tax=Sphingobacterium spiritivorum TaxID=258 RepID=UPI003DA36504